MAIDGVRLASWRGGFMEEWAGTAVWGHVVNQHPETSRFTLLTTAVLLPS